MTYKIFFVNFHIKMDSRLSPKNYCKNMKIKSHAKERNRPNARELYHSFVLIMITNISF